MLRIAVPNKGSLSETAAEMLLEAGYAGRRDPRALSASSGLTFGGAAGAPWSATMPSGRSLVVMR